MNLHELLTHHCQPSAQGVPDWMLGYFKRYSISFADGSTDLQTNVCWLQSRNFTIDLRLPVQEQQVTAKPWKNYSIEELLTLADYEGWEALCDWKGDTLSWRSTENSLQFHNRWTEPAILKRIGNCMIELSPSNVYVEDWRLQPSKPGALIGLRLLEERNTETGIVRYRGGGLIVCGDYAGLVLGRAQVEAPTPVSTTIPVPEVTPPQRYNILRELVVEHQDSPEKLDALFNFETSVAQGSLSEGYRIALSTKPDRIGEFICPMDGFEFIDDSNINEFNINEFNINKNNSDESNSKTQLIRQTLTCQGEPCERIFAVDTIEKSIQYDQKTPFTPEAKTWYDREDKTLTRYSTALF